MKITKIIVFLVITILSGVWRLIADPVSSNIKNESAAPMKLITCWIYKIDRSTVSVAKFQNTSKHSILSFQANVTIDGLFSNFHQEQVWPYSTDLRHIDNGQTSPHPIIKPNETIYILCTFGKPLFSININDLLALSQVKTEHELEGEFTTLPMKITIVKTVYASD